MTSTNSDEIKSVSLTSDSENHIKEEKIKNFIYPVMPKRNPHLYDKIQTKKITTNLFTSKFFIKTLFI